MHFITTASPKQCSRCSSTDIITDVPRGDAICRACGEVIVSRMIDESSEWTIYSNDDRDRGDSVMRSSANGKETVWSQQTIFQGGSAEKRTVLQQAQFLSEEKVTIKAAAHLEMVSHLASKLELPSLITNEACDIFSRAVTEGHFRSVASKAKLLAATALCMSCRINGVGRTLAEIAAASDENMPAINKLQVKLSQELKLELGRVSPEAVVARLASTLGLASLVTELSRQTCQRVVEEELLTGVAPGTLAAVALMLTARAIVVVKGENAIFLSSLRRFSSRASVGSSSIRTSGSMTSPTNLNGRKLDASSAARTWFSSTFQSSPCAVNLQSSMQTESSNLCSKLTILSSMLPFLARSACCLPTTLCKQYQSLIPHSHTVLPASIRSCQPIAGCKSDSDLYSLFSIESSLDPNDGDPSCNAPVSKSSQSRKRRLEVGENKSPAGLSPGTSRDIGNVCCTALAEGGLSADVIVMETNTTDIAIPLNSLSSDDLRSELDDILKKRCI